MNTQLSPNDLTHVIEADRAHLEDEDGEESDDAVTVWVPGEEPYKPNRRAVTLGLIGEDYAEVTDGLEEGQTILVRSREFTEEELRGGGGSGD